MEQDKRLLSLVESVGDFISYWGFKSIDGRVWALIHLADEPVSTPQIVKTLNVSKGLVSIAINELVELKLIEQSGKVGHGALTYVSCKDVATVVRKIIKERELVSLSNTENRVKELMSYSDTKLESINISKAKLRDLSELTVLHKNLLEMLAQRKVKTIKDWIKFVARFSPLFIKSK